MKLAILLALSCLLVAACASPIATSQEDTARQTDSGSAPVAAAPADPDDDDDDDDDDDVDLDITDDDDDDDDDDSGSEDDDDDDDDEDYFERFFDDILGEDDDDDDDDSPASVAAPASTQPVISTASKPVTAVDYASVDYTAPGETQSNSDSAGPPNYEDDVTPEELAAGAVEGDLAEPSNALQASDVADPVKPEVVQPVSTPNEEDEEDDDDDDDDLDVSLDEDDDDDDDDEEDDDDDDDDDDDEDDLEDVVSDDVIEAKRSRSLEGGNLVPPVYITKYNRFVDNILERINRILRKNYDPVNVKLHNNNNNNNNKKKKKGHGKNNKKNKNTRRPSGNKKRPGHRSQDGVARSTTESVEATVNESLAAISAQLTAGNPLETVNTTETTTTPELATTKRSFEKGALSRARPQNRNGNKKTKKNKNKARQRPGARATLYGLSSIRRDGDVTVNMMSSHTTVRTKFTVGPLILKVEKEFGRGAKKDIRSATATTTEMSGKLNLRVLHGGAATLHSIRVMQPKQVRVESSDDHDKTREYVWKRSSHIAHVVSQKLTNATKSMLQPPPLPTSSLLA